MNKILDIIIPRFLEEWVALSEQEDGYYPVCSVKDLYDGEIPDAVAKFKLFNLFGLAIPYSAGDAISWAEYLNQEC